MTEIWTPIEFNDDPTTVLAADLPIGGDELSVADISKMPPAGRHVYSAIGTEAIKVIGGAENPYTVIRGQFGTTEAGHTTGDSLNHQVFPQTVIEVVLAVLDATGIPFTDTNDPLTIGADDVAQALSELGSYVATMLPRSGGAMDSGLSLGMPGIELGGNGITDALNGLIDLQNPLTNSTDGQLGVNIPAARIEQLLAGASSFNLSALNSTKLLTSTDAFIQTCVSAMASPTPIVKLPDLSVYGETGRGLFLITNATGFTLSLRPDTGVYLRSITGVSGNISMTTGTWVIVVWDPTDSTWKVRAQ